MVAVLALPEVVPFDLGMTAQVLHAAMDDSFNPLYRVEVCTVDGAAVTSSAGFDISPQADLSLFERADTVVVAGVHYGSRVITDGIIPDQVRSALQQFAKRGGRMVSVCTGAFVLAAAGLVDDLAVTTHWAHSDTFRKLFPQVELQPDVLFVKHDSVMTSAGVGAGVDLLLDVIRDDFGSVVANLAARRCVLPPWRSGGQGQFIVRPVPEGSDSDIREVCAWSLERLETPLTLADMAGHIHMSQRSFTRKFREETGQSPRKWLTAQRLERARRYLEETDLLIDEIAQQCGFPTGSALRQQFAREIGVSPRSYRATFHVRRDEIRSDLLPAG